jgi:hypothetical protein
MIAIDNRIPKKGSAQRGDIDAPSSVYDEADKADAVETSEAQTPVAVKKTPKHNVIKLPINPCKM